MADLWVVAPCVFCGAAGTPRNRVGAVCGREECRGAADAVARLDPDDFAAFADYQRRAACAAMDVPVHLLGGEECHDRR